MSESKLGIPFYRRRWFWAATLLLSVTAIAYFPALRGGFIWDDETFVTQNKLIKASDGLYRFWFTTEPADYWPVSYTAFWIEWRLWGGQTLGYHLVNLGLHVADCLLLWAILRRLRVPGAYVAAFLFAVHPVNVESVAWIFQLKNLMAMLFYLATIWFFLRSQCSQRPDAAEWRVYFGGAYGVSLLCFILAMLSKGSVAVLPVVLLGLMAWRRRLSLRDLAWALPYFAVAAVLAATDVWFQKHGTAEVFRNAGGLERLLGSAAVVWFYLSKALLPINLIFVYPQWHIQAGNPLWWAPLLAAAGVTAVLFRYRTSCTRPALFAWGYFCAALVPVMGFTDVYFMKFSLVADHYQHLALIGVVAFVGAGWGEWERKVVSRKGKVVSDQRITSSGSFSPSNYHLLLTTFYFPRIVAGAAILLLAALTWRQSGVYRDAETVWTRTLERNPASLVAENNLGDVLYASGRRAEAMAHFQKAARVKADSPDAHNNIGMVLATQGRLPEATAQLEEALRLKPNYPEALVNLGNVMEKEGRSSEAILDYEDALKLEPDDADAHRDLGIALAGAGRGPDAAVQFEAALRFNPDDATAHAGLGAALADAGREAEAAAQYEEAVRLSPNFPETHYNLGIALAQTGRMTEAITQFEEAVRLKPDYAEARANLGTALVNAGRLPEAAAQLEQAAQLSPDSAQIHANLGTVLRALGREDEAKAEFGKANRLGNGQ